MMDWNRTLGVLRERFLRGSGDRLDHMEACLAKLENDAGDGDALGDLHLAFHAFSGLGGAYGYPGVTQIGMKGERRSEDLISEGNLPSDLDLGTFRDLVDELHWELSSPEPYRELAAQRSNADAVRSQAYAAR